MSELTKKQSLVLEKIKAFIKDNGFPPTRVELAKIMNYPSPNSITLHLEAIEKKGYITRIPKAARSIVVVEK